MKKASRDKKTVVKKKPAVKQDRITKGYAKLPLWAKLRIAYGMATKTELTEFNKMANSIIARSEKKMGTLKLSGCAPGTHCLFTCLQSCTEGCRSSCTSSCTKSCTSNCEDSCLGMPGCMGSVGIVGAQ